MTIKTNETTKNIVPSPPSTVLCYDFPSKCNLEAGRSAKRSRARIFELPTAATLPAALKAFLPVSYTFSMPFCMPCCILFRIFVFVFS